MGSAQRYAPACAKLDVWVGCPLSDAADVEPALQHQLGGVQLTELLAQFSCAASPASRNVQPGSDSAVLGDGHRASGRPGSHPICCHAQDQNRGQEYGSRGECYPRLETLSAERSTSVSTWDARLGLTRCRSGPTSSSRSRIQANFSRRAARLYHLRLPSQWELGSSPKMVSGSTMPKPSAS